MIKAGLVWSKFGLVKRCRHPAPPCHPPGWPFTVLFKGYNHFWKLFPNWMWHEGVKEYFQIACRTQGSRSIFEFNVARGCPGVFSNLVSHAGVQEYFQIEWRTQGSRSIFKLNVACRFPEVFSNSMSHAGSWSIFKLTVARGCPGVFSNWISHAGVQE